MGAFLALVGVLAPVESPNLPGPLDDHLGSAEAAAQTPPPSSVVEGTPKPCRSSPAPWTPATGDPDYLTASECVLELPACPVSPLYSGTFMRLSVMPDQVALAFPTLPAYPAVTDLESYPDFCEDRVLLVDDQATYDACVSITGYVVNTFTDDLGQVGCRLLYPTTCPAGLLSNTSKTCRAVQRRTWTCPANHVARNQFNSCYALQAAAPDPHPACATGSPDFVAMPLSCEDYVGTDFFASGSGDVDCAATYLTSTPVQPGAPTVQMSVSPSDHWCSYNQVFLDGRCHRVNGGPSLCQTPSTALCVKRASQTGGCDGIAKTIRCRAYQAAFRWNNMSPEEVRSNGCTPCVILPFSPIPIGCPQDTDAAPRTPYLGDTRVILREEADFAITHQECESVRQDNMPLASYPGCAQLPVCADPPAGTLAWESAHDAGVAIVNVAVIVTVTNLGMSRSTTQQLVYDPDPDPGDSPLAVGQNFVVRFQRYRRDDRRVRTFTEIDPTSAPTAIDQIPAGSATEAGNECAFGGAPYFKLMVQELWPDNGPDYDDNDPNCVVPIGGNRPGSDAEVIIDLFGSDSLRWWCALSAAERQRRTLARGLEWWDDPLTDQDGRVAEQTEEVFCDFTEVVGTTWCRWVPSRPGFYRLHAGGAWTMTRYYDRVPAASRLTLVLDYLNGWVNDPDPDNPPYVDPAVGATRRAALEAQLVAVRRSASQIGLTDDLTAALPLAPDAPSDWLYSSNPGRWANCPSTDLRIYCDSTVSGNYTKTEPIGIMVHQVRVSTVTPSR